MSLDYSEIICHTSSSDSLESLMALLSNEGFESFVEEETVLKAYMPADKFIVCAKAVSELLGSNAAVTRWEIGNIEAQNWNELWEREYQPVWIEDRLLIRAPFHQALKSESLAIELVIEPKMSFGTGHHSTTSLMAARMLDMDFKGRKVLDMGCGTGILAILASKLGATLVTAIDNHPWACLNSEENCERNSVTNVKVIEGDASALGEECFDVLLANINRNILLMDMRHYRAVLAEGGRLVISGFLHHELEALNTEAAAHGLKFESYSRDADWVAASYTL